MKALFAHNASLKQTQFTKISLQLVTVTLTLLAASSSFATTLICTSKSTQLKAEMLAPGKFGATSATSLPDGENLYGTELSLFKANATVSTFVSSLQALDDNCEIDLPNDLKPNYKFVAHLRCFDQNNKMVNDDPTEGMAGPLHGEAMNCSVK